jgi:hypothetical protein
MSFGAKFLRTPEVLPAPEEGEPWGDGEVALDLPGGPYRFAGLSPAQVDGVRATFPGCACDRRADAAAGGATPGAAAGGAVAVRLLRAAAGDFLPIDTRGWEYELDVAWAADSVRLAGIGLLGRLDLRPVLQGTLWTCEDGGERFPGTFENFFRVLVAYRLLDLGAVVLHSAGVVKEGAAYLFLGRSGAGKTTVARLGLARGGEVLSDDLNALVIEGGRCMVRKLPFTGELGERRELRPPVPLGGLLRLHKDTRDALRPLSRAQALASLLACSPFVNIDPYRRERLEETLLALLAAGAPAAFALQFSLSGGFWPILGVE